MTVERTRLIDTFFQLARIESLTYQEKDVIEFLASSLSDLGLRVQIDNAGDKIGGNTGNLIAHLPGDDSKPAIFFNCHVDTVEPGRDIEPIERDGTIIPAGDTILGADDKVGVAALLELARVLTSTPTRHGPIDLVFTVAEEKGLLGAKHLDWDLVTGRYGFVLDAAGPVGYLIVTAPWQDSVEVTFQGRAAHAGLSPERGVSAIRAATRAIEAMSLGRIDPETTANIGVIEGGRAANIVPETAIIKGEARSLVPSKLEKQTKSMVEAAQRAAEEIGAKADIRVKREYEGFRLTKNDKVVAWATEALKSVGITPSLVATGGGSDTNVFNARGISTVNLGVGYESPHTIQESISVDELERVARAAVAIALVVACG
jgi:tripeptide aminopeptidase